MGNLPLRTSSFSHDNPMALNDPNTTSSSSSSSSSAEPAGCLTFGADTTGTATTTTTTSKSDNQPPLSILRSTAAATTDSDSMDDLEHLYGPAHLNPEYLASLFPALANTTASPLIETETAGFQHTSLTSGTAAGNPETSSPIPSSAYQTIYANMWNNASTESRSEGDQWRQPAKKFKDNEAEAHSDSHRDEQDGIQAAHPGASQGKHLQQTAAAAAGKAGFYQKLDHMRMLEVPEVISCIFEFLDKPSLASASRVSKLWRTYSTPLMWRHVVDRNWLHRTFCSLISGKAQWVRTIHCEVSTDYDLLLRSNMAHLNTVSFRGSHDSIETKMAILQNSKKTLASLSLNGVASTLSTDVARVIQSLQRLSVLKITRTSITGSFLQMVLDGCRDLEFLSLRGITFLPNADRPADQHPRALLQNQPLSQILYLNLRNVQLEDKDLVEIVAACPELRELSIAGNTSLQEYTHLAKVLRHSCPHVYALDMASCVEVTSNHFTALWTMLGPQLKIINLAGTKLEDKDLALLGRECQSLTRLDIQYCTFITTKGLHEFLCTVSSTLQQLEASGLTIDPDQIDDREWVCSGLEVLVIHINLFDRRRLCSDGRQDQVQHANSSTATAAITEPTGVLPLSKSVTKDTAGEVTLPVTTAVAVDLQVQTNESVASGCPLENSTAPSVFDEDVVMESPPMEDVSENLRLESTISCIVNDPLSTAGNRDSAVIANMESLASVVKSPKESSTTLDENMQQDQASLSQATEPVTETGTTKRDRHPYHPIQQLTKLHYLGLMGTGAARLVEPLVGEFITAFEHVDHLDLSGLSQAFRKQDLTWLIESLPSLFQIDAEHYHISDDLRKWCRKEYPEITIHRKGR